MRAPLVVAALAVAIGGCKESPTASPAQCEHLLDRYIDLRLSEDPAAARLTTEDRASFRGKLALDVLLEARVAKVKDRCTTVTQAEYECAVKAPTARSWTECIH